MRIKVWFLLALAAPTVVQAHCAAPSPPFQKPPYIIKPNVPLCAARKNCSDSELSVWKRELDMRVAGWKHYLDETNRLAEQYKHDALEYALCRIKE